ncbi:MAG: hypothetical protein V2A79_19615 [Planctomycetota bacterium]
MRTFALTYLRLITVSLAVAVALFLLGYYPTLRIAGPSAIGAMVAGIGTSLAAGCIGSLPIGLAGADKADRAVSSILLATLLRFLVALTIAGSLLLSGWFNRAVLGLWIGLSYLAMLVVDATFAVQVMGRVREKHSS